MDKIAQFGRFIKIARILGGSSSSKLKRNASTGTCRRFDGDLIQKEEEEEEEEEEIQVVVRPRHSSASESSTWKKDSEWLARQGFKKEAKEKKEKKEKEVKEKKEKEAEEKRKREEAEDEEMSRGEFHCGKWGCTSRTTTKKALGMKGYTLEGIKNHFRNDHSGEPLMLYACRNPRCPLTFNSLK